MEFRILGPLEVLAEGRPVQLASGKGRSLLALLVVSAPEVVSAERLIDAIWGDEDVEHPAATLQHHVSRLRKALEPERPANAPATLLVTRKPGYALAIALNQVDARRFEQLVADGRRVLTEGKPEPAQSLLEEALSLWRGPALADFTYEPFAQSEIARLEELRLVALEERLEADLVLGHSADLVGELEQLIAEQPHRERLRRQLMLALYRSGQQAEALAAYQETRKLLSEELGIEPSPALRGLERAILQQDPSLEAPVPREELPAAVVPANGAAAPAALGPVLLTTKLNIAVPRREFVVRERLLEQLRAGLDGKLTVVTAPPGSGKTALLSSWCATDRATCAFAWVSLDEGDNDPARFFLYLIEALRTVEPEIGALALALLRAPGARLKESVLPTLLNELASLRREIVLVLDDYHLITNDDVKEAMAFVLEHLPATLHLVLVTRADPLLPLARLRARGELNGLSMDELRFDTDEAGRLLNDALGLELSAEDVARLQQRTEGWAAGLSLAALSLRGRVDPTEYIESFAGDERELVDYLGAEVLERQPDERRTFLLQTSVLERLCGPLCDAVTDSGGSARLLEELEHANLFLVPLDSKRHWYRYHQLFSELLRHELEAATPQLVGSLHRRASAWFQEAGFIPEAIHHATEAGDFAIASDLIAQQWFHFVREGHPVTVAGWLEALPSDVVRRDSRLCLIWAWYLRNRGRLAEVEPWLEAAEREPSQGTLRDGSASVTSAVATIRALIALFEGDVGRALEAAQRAYELEADKSSQGYVRASVALGLSLFWSGKQADAVEPLEETVRVGQSTRQELPVVHALGCLAALRLDEADQLGAEELARQALDLADEHHAGELLQTALSYLVRGRVLGSRGEFARAEAELERGLELAGRASDRMQIAYGLMALAGVRGARGDRSGADRAGSEARRTVESCEDPGILGSLLADAERQLNSRAEARSGTASSRTPRRELNGGQ